MAIRKDDLRDFIAQKAKERKDAIRGVVLHEVKATISPVVHETYKGAAPLERQAQQFHDSLSSFLEEHNNLSTWSRQAIVRDINSHVIGLRESILSKLAVTVTYNLLDRGTNHIDSELLPFVDSLKVELAKNIEKYHALDKLTDEIMTIIDSSHNGSKAHKRLEELGVDLSGFATSSTNLPAVTKLSVDVCVINDNCRGDES